MTSTSASKASKTSKTQFVASTFPENPLPTDFHPPASSCSGIYWTNNVFAIDNDAECLPNKFNGASTAFYSPGTACPTGYTAQPQCTNNNGVRSVTTVTCCPYRGDVTLSCVQDDLTLAGVWETQFCTWMAGPSTVIEYTLTTDGKVSKGAATMSSRDGVNAWGVRMVYQASDLVPKSTGATATGTATGTGTSAGSGASNTSSAGADADASTGLSTGGIVAVAVVVPVVVIAALAGLFLWWRRRKHRYAGVQQPQPSEVDGRPPPGQQGAYAYQGGSYQGSNYAPSEMAGGGVAPYYHNDKVLMNPNQMQGGAGQQFKGYPHPPPPAELPSAEAEPAELPAEGRRT